MKCLFVLLSLLSFIASVLGELPIFELCPTECSAMKICYETTPIPSQIQFYPPVGEFGKCICQDRLNI